MTPLGRYIGAHLHRRLFAWFGVTIFFTAVAVGVSAMLVQPDGTSWRATLNAAERFAAGRFAAVWTDQAKRSELAQAVAGELNASVVLSDPNGRVFASYGGQCRHNLLHSAVSEPDTGRLLGHVGICFDRNRGFNPLRGLVVLFAALFVLWAASGKIARRITRPLAEVVRVAEQIGAGDLRARVTFHGHRRRRHPLLHHHHHHHHHGHPMGEERVLGSAINDMAARIERQMADQRELLAAVSHEIRTPLARIRILTELAREAGGASKPLDELDQEVVEIDALVGDLLASSRIEFGSLSLRPLDAADVARRALERAGLPAGMLAVEAPQTALEADATLLSRALANLLENARKHAGGATRLRVSASAGRVAFEVEDAGAGFAADEDEKVFRPFYRVARGEEDAVSLGLGLALVKRIAEAHQGRAYARNRPGGGAVVGLELPSRPATV